MVLSKVTTHRTESEHLDTEPKPKSCSHFFGKVIARIATTCVSVAKVALSTTATLGLMALPSFGFAIERSTFRPYVRRFIRPGWQETRQYTMSVDTERHLETYQQCHQLATKYLQMYKLNYSLPSQPQGYSSGPIKMDGLTRNINYFVDQRYGERYAKAVDFVEKTFLQGESPFEKTDPEIIQYLKDVHRVLTEDRPATVEKNETEITKYLKQIPEQKIGLQLLPGTFRTSMKMIGTSQDPSFYAYKAQQVLTPSERKIFDPMFTKAILEGILVTSSNEEKEIWRKVGLHVCLEPHNINLHMHAFANLLRTLISLHTNPIDLAANFHMILVTMSPFVTANGKLARLLLNAILVRYAGLAPLVFPSQKAYLDAVQEASSKNDHTRFAKFLREVIRWNEEKSAILRYMPVNTTRTFPDETALMMHPGFMLTQDGTGACSLNAKSDEPNWCEWRISTTLKDGHEGYIISNLDNPEPQMANGVFHDAMYFKMNPQVLKNYNEALAVAEDLILKNPVAFIQNVTTTIEIFDALHIALSSNLPDSKQQTPGFYRTTRKIVYVVNTKHTLSEDELKIFMKNQEDIKKTPRNLADLEVAIWKKAGAYFPPYPEHIDDEMKAFAANLQLLIEREEDFIYIAAFAHTGIARILPYRKNNGKLARLLMNSILLRYLGISPVIIPDKQEYHAATDKAVRGDLDAFIKYLQKLIPAPKTTYTTCND